MELILVRHAEPVKIVDADGPADPPLAATLGVEVIVDSELAEYDRDATSYIPIEELKANKDERWMAMVEGSFEDRGIDPVEFKAGVVKAMEHVITGNPGGSVAVVCHGGVINAYLAHILGIERPLWFEPKYTSIHRVLASRRGDRSLQALNETAHLRGTNLLV
jgi:probable phosphoglycerate mutase